MNGHTAKALIDQQTVGANLVSNKFCAVHNIEMEPLEKPISIQMTLKRSRASTTNKVIVEINYALYQEQEEFYVCNLQNWYIILRDPALVKHKTIITIETGRTTLMPKEYETIRVEIIKVSDGRTKEKRKYDSCNRLDKNIRSYS